jgi:ABC-type phosphate/phosphonate transport system substrate-binding protein
MKSLLLRLATLLALFGGSASSADKPMLVVVMDPLCKELACDCVKGYAQRNYRVLTAHLQRKLGLQVDIAHGETIAAAVKDTGRTPDLVIGKSSVVQSQARLNKLTLAPIARLTGKDGSPDQHGLIVVRKDMKAEKLADLKGYRILFGPEDCDEKSAAAMELLKAAGIELPAKLETSSSCATAAEALMQLNVGVDAAAVISSYAEPLLSGCGTIQKGDLRIVGKTKEVPFITAFANQSLEPSRIKAVTETLLDTASDPELLKAMESLLGFVEIEEAKSPAKPGAWNQFRGPQRDGVTPWLPATLPAKPAFAWEFPLPSDGVGGIAATEKLVIVSGRDRLDRTDFFFVSTR